MNPITEKIESLKDKKNAVILVHNYQLPEIHDIADYTGDSLGLSREAAATDAEVIIFCGVDFMAETAKLLSPEKKVILPASDATCPMADMITPEALRLLKDKNPGVPVVTYVNSTASVKAESDICCTSSNAVKVVRSLKAEKIIFTPDRNLASYVEKETGVDIIKWGGFCPVHERITKQEVLAKKEEYPEAVFMVHPECRPEVVEMADYVVSTGGMLEIPAKDSSDTFIVGTEAGMVYPLSKKFPKKKFIPLSSSAVCKNMKKNTLQKIYSSLKDLQPQIDISYEVSEKAGLALRRMLKVS